MKLMRTSIFVFSFFIVLISERVAMTNDQGNLVQVKLKNGNEIIELLTDISPNLVKKDFNERTGFMTSSGNFLRYEKDNIVRSKTQVDRYKEVMNTARTLASGPTVALKLIKQLYWDSFSNNFEGQLAAESSAQTIAGKTEDSKIGVMSFIQKKKAEFKGK